MVMHFRNCRFYSKPSVCNEKDIAKIVRLSENSQHILNMVTNNLITTPKTKA